MKASDEPVEQPVKEITIVSANALEECVFHIIFTPAGNIFRYINVDYFGFGINIDERINILCNDIDIAALIYNSSMEKLRHLIERLEIFLDSGEHELELWQDSSGLLGFTNFNEGGSF